MLLQEKYYPEWSGYIKMCNSSKIPISREKLDFIVSLVKQQTDMLTNKKNCLAELFDICENQEQLNLVKQLIINFTEMNDEVYNMCLIDMANKILERNFSLSECLVVAMAHDHMPDSSQSVLQDLKLSLCMKGFPPKNFCNRIDRSWSKDFRFIRHFFIVDDFVGSGSTVLSRKNEFTRIMTNNKREFTLHFITVAGMSFALDNLHHQEVDIYCSFPLLKGISEKYPSDEVIQKLQIMTQLEGKLASKINEKQLSEFHLGYKESEALFCRKNKNIPNNVFPLFWWKRYANNTERKPLYERVQEGY